MYRVTIHVVPNLPLPPKQRFCFMYMCLILKQNFCLDVNGRLRTMWMVSWSSCRLLLLGTSLLLGYSEATFVNLEQASTACPPLTCRPTASAGGRAVAPPPSPPPPWAPWCRSRTCCAPSRRQARTFKRRRRAERGEAQNVRSELLEKKIIQ